MEKRITSNWSKFRVKHLDINAARSEKQRGISYFPWRAMSLGSVIQDTEFGKSFGLSWEVVSVGISTLKGQWDGALCITTVSVCLFWQPWGAAGVWVSPGWNGVAGCKPSSTELNPALAVPALCQHPSRLQPCGGSMCSSLPCPSGFFTAQLSRCYCGEK